MSCPYCGHTEILYSAQQGLNAFRAVVGSAKRYCPNCERKWRVRSRTRAKTIRDLFLCLVVGTMGVFILDSFGVLNLHILPGGKKRSGPLTQLMATAMQQDPRFHELQGTGLGKDLKGYLSGSVKDTSSLEKAVQTKLKNDAGFRILVESVWGTSDIKELRKHAKELRKTHSDSDLRKLAAKHGFRQ